MPAAVARRPWLRRRRRILPVGYRRRGLALLGLARRPPVLTAAVLAGLRAVVAAQGIFGAFAGPWSAGTGAMLLLQAAAEGSAISPALNIRGGIGALGTALRKAATGAGAEIRTNAEAVNILVKSGKAAAVVLADGQQIPARAILSTADPKNTFLNLVDPTELDPNFLLKVRNYRSTGTVAKVNLALSGLPAFAGVKNDASDLSGRIHIAPEVDYIERAYDAAKYGDFSSEPYMDITIPSIADPSLAPRGAHVMSIHVQYAPYELKRGDWKSRREEFGDAAVKAAIDMRLELQEFNRRMRAEGQPTTGQA